MAQYFITLFTICDFSEKSIDFCKMTNKQKYLKFKLLFIQVVYESCFHTIIRSHHFNPLFETARNVAS